MTSNFYPRILIILVAFTAKVQYFKGRPEGNGWDMMKDQSLILGLAQIAVQIDELQYRDRGAVGIS